jgi:hypothetical protein
MAPTARAVVPARPAVPVRTVNGARTLQRNAAIMGRRTITVAVHRPRTAALGIAAVAVVLLSVLFYLSQTFQATAARYELDRLATERDALLQELRSQDGRVTSLGAMGLVEQWAQDHDLDSLTRTRRFGAD